MEAAVLGMAITTGVCPGFATVKDSTAVDSPSLAKGQLGPVISGAHVLPGGDLVVWTREKRDEAPAVIRLWPGEAVSHEVAAPEGRFRCIDVPTMTAYLPNKDNSDGTAVIVCPGGTYSVCDFNHHGTRLAERLNPVGIAVFVLKYRLRPPSKNVRIDALADAERTVRLLRSRAAEYGINPKRIGMVGYSAGANLTLHVASEFDGGDARHGDPVERFSSRPDFMVLLCPWAGAGGTRCPYKLRKNSPPAFVCHSKDDKVAPVSVAQDTADMLNQLQIPVELHLFETGGHGNFTPGGPTPGGEWTEKFITWIRTISP